MATVDNKVSPAHCKMYETGMKPNASLSTFYRVAPAEERLNVAMILVW